MSKIKLISLLAAAFVVLIGIALTQLQHNEGVAKEAQKKYLTIKGSDTMVHLVSAWAEDFMKAHPEVEISVTGGGSGTGIAALINGTTDICASSRTIKQEEIDLGRQKGVNSDETKVALDGIAVIVNPSNPISTLTMEQVRKIYTGEYGNWSQVGGPRQDFIILSRESSSGTYVFFQEHVLEKKDYTPRARLMPATSAIIQTVSADKSSIGYVGLGYALEAQGKVKMLRIKANDAAKAVMPSESAVKSGEYSISRPLFLYTNGAPTGTVKEFVDFCLGRQGQDIVRQAGYVTIN
jgi:phosphate transport system substrate-binding protein